MASEHIYDVVVIGSGPSGRTVSSRLVKNGMSVALVENELIGGECHFWACIPSKALLLPPEALTEAHEVEGAKQAVHGRLSAESSFWLRQVYQKSGNPWIMTMNVYTGIMNVYSIIVRIMICHVLVDIIGNY